MSKANTTSIDFSGGLFLIFLILKLVPGTPVNNWSWWWVTSPLWIPFAIVGLIALIIFIVAIIVAISKWVAGL